MALRIERDVTRGVALVALDRPEKLNAIDLETAAALPSVWRELRYDAAVRAVVLTGTGTRAFCTGIDRGVRVPQPPSPYALDDPLLRIGPKANDLWKPVVAAVGGAAGRGRGAEGAVRGGAGSGGEGRGGERRVAGVQHAGRRRHARHGPVTVRSWSAGRGILVAAGGVRVAGVIVPA